MEYNKEKLEVILKRFEDSKTVKRIISIDPVAMLAPGENYCSVVTRVKMQVVLGNGRIATRSAVLKRVSDLPENRDAFGASFITEIKIYSTVLKEMEVLMEEFEDTRDVLFCQMIDYKPYTSLFLEDLKVSGFKMTPRNETLDMEHCILVLRSLGRFHGMAKVLEERGLISKNDYREYVFVDNLFIAKNFVHKGSQLLADAMEKFWEPEWKCVGQKLKIPYEDFQKEFSKLSRGDEWKFSCLTHGDCWSNNMMFKYDETNRPIALRFVDMQFSYYTSPSADVMFFLYTSVDAKLRRENLPMLVECWYRSLIDTLDRYGYSGKKPTYREFDQEIKDMKYLIFLFLAMNIVSRADSHLPFVIKKDKTTGEDYSIFDEMIFRDETLKYRWGPELRDLAEKLP